MSPRQSVEIFLFTVLTVACSIEKKHDARENLKDETIEIHEAFNRYFEECGVDGTIVIYDNVNNKWIMSDSAKARIPTLPASTFKIPNLLIALEKKVIEDENEVVKWVGKTDTAKYGYRPEIYKDMTVAEAFELSAGWVFIELADRVGRENYKKYLAACSYGNLDLSHDETDFWNFGKFAVSPVSQVKFMKKLYEGRLPFSERNMEIAKRVMITEQNEKYTIRAKTGWTRENNTNTGWWVGYIETESGSYFFATRLLQDRKDNRQDFGTCRKEITKKVFKDLGIIN